MFGIPLFGHNVCNSNIESYITHLHVFEVEARHFFHQAKGSGGVF